MYTKKKIMTDAVMRKYYIAQIKEEIPVRCKLQTKEAENEYPEASKIIQLDFYVNDCITGANTILKAIDLAE